MVRRKLPLNLNPVPLTPQGTTKGPWLPVLRATDGRLPPSKGRFIWRTEGDGIGYRMVCRYINTDADAYLIAATPDLYAACAELIRGGGTSESLQRAIDLARAALTLADRKEV